MREANHDQTTSFSSFLSYFGKVLYYGFLNSALEDDKMIYDVPVMNNDNPTTMAKI
jgi:hypothetical protein